MNRRQVDDLDETLRNAMVNNAVLDNEKQAYSYQVETLKYDIEELEENFYRLQKEYKDRTRAFDLLNRDYNKLKDDNDVLKECLRQRDQLIEDNGLVLISSGDGLSYSHLNGDITESESIKSGASGVNNCESVSGATLISQEASKLLEDVDGATLESKLRTLFQERQDLLSQIRQLKMDLEEERRANTNLSELGLLNASQQSLNGPESKLLEAQRESSKVITEYKFKLKKADQESSAFQSTIQRLETQLARYKQASEEAEKVEDELKTEKRKILREFREAQARIDELETLNAHLEKRIDKLKSSKIAIINS